MSYKTTTTPVPSFCRVGNTYPKQCTTAGHICKPIEGHFCTECEVDGCKKLG